MLWMWWWCTYCCVKSIQHILVPSSFDTYVEYFECIEVHIVV
jgi:hypothetical protein